MSVVDRIGYAESGNNPYAKNPLSSAGGLNQFVDKTWLMMMLKEKPELVRGKSRSEILALKYDPELSKEMAAAYARDNAAHLQANGLPVTDGTTYLSHFAGPSGAVSILKADPNASAISVLDPDGSRGILKANPFLKDMTASQLAAWADKKMSPPEAAAPGGQGVASPGPVSPALASDPNALPPLTPPVSPDAVASAPAAASTGATANSNPFGDVSQLAALMQKQQAAKAAAAPAPQPMAPIEHPELEYMRKAQIAQAALNRQQQGI